MVSDQQRPLMLRHLPCWTSKHICNHLKPNIHLFTIYYYLLNVFETSHTNALQCRELWREKHQFDRKKKHFAGHIRPQFGSSPNKKQTHLIHPKNRNAPQHKSNYLITSLTSRCRILLSMSIACSALTSRDRCESALPTRTECINSVCVCAPAASRSIEIKLTRHYLGCRHTHTHTQPSNRARIGNAHRALAVRIGMPPCCALVCCGGGGGGCAAQFRRPKVDRK